MFEIEFNENEIIDVYVDDDFIIEKNTLIDQKKNVLFQKISENVESYS